MGRYFCACFVFNFSPPFAPRRGRRDAEQRGAVAGWCAVVLVRMHISVPHILIQGVITRLSSAHSHHRLNHPPPPPPPPAPLLPPPPDPHPPTPPLRLFLLLHHQSSCGSPSPTQPPTILPQPLLPATGRIFLQTASSLSLSFTLNDTQLSLFLPVYAPSFAYSMIF